MEEKSQRILLGVSGSIALYKSLDLCRILYKEGVEVQVLMSYTAKKWIHPVLFEAITGKKVYYEHVEENMPHIFLREGVKLFLIAPASANLIARASCGMADDLLCATLLSFPGERWIAPAMNPFMYRHPATQRNIKTLESFGYRILYPTKGEVVCGDYGEGKMLSPEEIAKEVLKFLREK